MSHPIARGQVEAACPRCKTVVAIDVVRSLDERETLHDDFTQPAVCPRGCKLCIEEQAQLRADVHEALAIERILWTPEQ